MIGKEVYSGSRDETVRVWNGAGECISVIKLGALAYGKYVTSLLLFLNLFFCRCLVGGFVPLHSRCP